MQSEPANDVRSSDLRASLNQQVNDLKQTGERLEHIADRLRNIASHYDRLLSDLRNANKSDQSSDQSSDKSNDHLSDQRQNDLANELRNVLAKFTSTAKEV